MTQTNRAPVIAIAIESAEPSLVRRMIQEDQLPVLKRLLSAGKWVRIESPASIGTSSVWPTFMTGTEPSTHGVYSEWCWDPATMGLSRFDGQGLDPFWRSISAEGCRVGILAVPFMPFVGVNGFEITESEPYLPGKSPETAHANGDVSKQEARAALTHGRISVSGPRDLKSLQRLAADSVEGIRLRAQLAQKLLTTTKPDLSIVVFTETHESAHCLWQSAEPHHPLFNEDIFKPFAAIRPTLREIYQEVDRQIGRILDSFKPDANVLVFSLHGMTPARGVPTFLAPLMSRAGFSPVHQSENKSAKQQAIALMGEVKRHMPEGLKRLYYKTLPAATVLQLATPNMMPQYDWARTRAFSLVTEQHGSIRVNLIGREAEGIVALEEYDGVCKDVEQWLLTLKTKDGKKLAKKIFRTADSAQQALARRIPDMLVHWTDEAFIEPLQIEGCDTKFPLDGRRYLSQHTSEGFCILKSYIDYGLGETLLAKDLGALITRMVVT